MIFSLSLESTRLNFSIRLKFHGHKVNLSTGDSTWRVPGLPIRDCARGCNNRAHTRPQLSAINMTGKTFFERLYSVPGMGTFGF